MPAKHVMAVEVRKRRFDVHEYHRLATAGILSMRDRVELIDGEVIAMTPVGPRHVAAVNRAARALFSQIPPRAGIVQVQSPVRLNRLNEPQPDLAVLRPVDDFYASHLPGPSDILLVVEIADSSLEYDRQVKSVVYAEMAVPEYWLVDLDGCVVSCYAEPVNGQYQKVREIRAGGSVTPTALPECAVAIDDLFAD